MAISEPTPTITLADPKRLADFIKTISSDTLSDEAVRAIGLEKNYQMGTVIVNALAGVDHHVVDEGDVRRVAIELRVIRVTPQHVIVDVVALDPDVVREPSGQNAVDGVGVDLARQMRKEKATEIKSGDLTRLSTAASQVLHNIIGS